MAYAATLVLIVSVNVILAVTLQFVMGFAGVPTFAHPAFYAIGAYVAGWLSLQGSTFVVSLALGAAAAALVARLFFAVTGRLRGDYLAVSTFAFAFVVHAVALNAVGVTGGALGVGEIPRPLPLRDWVDENWQVAIIAALTAALVYAATARVAGGTFGVVLQAARDNELGLRILGKSAHAVRAAAFAFGSAMAGVAGGLYCHYTTYLSPDSFQVFSMLPLLCMVTLGGVGSLRGTLWAAVLLSLVPEALRLLPLAGWALGPARDCLFAILLVALIVKRPAGFGGLVQAG